MGGLDELVTLIASDVTGGERQDGDPASTPMARRFRRDCQRISAHPKERNASLMSEERRKSSG